MRATVARLAIAPKKPARPSSTSGSMPRYSAVSTPMPGGLGSAVPPGCTLPPTACSNARSSVAEQRRWPACAAAKLVEREGHKLVLFHGGVFKNYIKVLGAFACRDGDDRMKPVTFRAAGQHFVQRRIICTKGNLYDVSWCVGH